MSSSTLPMPAVAVADAIISDFHAKPDQIVALPGRGAARTLREIICAAVDADRAARTERAAAVAESIAYANYGPEGSIETFREAEALALCSEAPEPIDGKLLLGAALSMGHLDADGILAMMREAAR